MSINAASKRKHTSIIADEVDACHHCGGQDRLLNRLGFCCSGCESAHALIIQLGFARFYKSPGFKLESVDVVQSEQTSLDYFDHSQVIDAIAERKSGGRLAVELNVSGLTCFACGWLLERSLQALSGSVSAVVNMRRESIAIEFNPNTVALSDIIGRIYELGFSVKISLEKQQNKLDSLILKLGVAAFCSMNVMLLAISDYFDTDRMMTSGFESLFHTISLVLASVSLFYSGSEFTRRAIHGWREKKYNIEQPIVLALLLTYLYSMFSTFRGNGFVFFDSVTLVIFVLLASRTLQSYVLDKARVKMCGSTDLSMKFCRVKTESSEWELKEVSSSLKGECVMAHHKETIPVRCKVESPYVYVSLESINGEAEPYRYHQGQQVPAGAISLTDKALFILEEDGSKSYLVRLQQHQTNISKQNADRSQIEDRLARYFLWIVTFVSSVVLAYWWGVDIAVGFERAVAVLLIACPCSIAFAAPLVYARIESLAFRRGIIFKNHKSVQNLSFVRSFYWDKTGTLTVGHPKIVEEDLKDESHPVLNALVQLDDFSNHHVIHALSKWSLKKKKTQEQTSVLSFNEVDGRGVEFNYDGFAVKIGKASFCGLHLPGSIFNVHVVSNNIHIASFLIEDSLRPEARKTLKSLEEIGVSNSVLSGDQKSVALRAGRELMMDEKYIHADLDPEQKLKVFSQDNRCKAMVGNGFNDSLVLASAAVSISVAGSHNTASAIADVNIFKDSLETIPVALSFAKTAVKKLKRITIFAIVYNLCAMIAAVMGYVSPLVAAIIMPVSSFIVILISVWGKK